MKILLVHNFYQQFGGEDAVALSERRLLEQHGHEVFFYSRHNDDLREYGLLNKIAFFPDTIFSTRTAQEIRKVVQEFKPDVAYIHNFLPLVSPSVHHVLHALKVPIIQVLHNFRPYCPNGLFYTQGAVCEKCKGGNYLHAIRNRCCKDSYMVSALYAATFAFNRAAGMVDKIDAFVCLTEFARQKMVELGVPQSKLFVRPNFIETPPATQGPFTGNGKYVLFLGRLSAEKGLWTLIRAFEPFKDVELRVLGTGPLERELRAYARDNKLHNIAFYGFRNGEDKWHLLRGCSFTVVPSEWYENFPVSVLEAYACGKPVVASNTGGLSYVVENGNTGLLFEPANVSDLRGKLEHLLARPAEAAEMGTRARHLVETKYSPRTCYESLVRIFHSVQAHAGVHGASAYATA
jgi:glycosyltransferase involved in cell wall biosynthesis